jgi:hypothetical protein
MFDSDAQALADRLYADARRKREAHLAGSLMSMTNEATKRNALGNGRFHAALADICAAEFHARVDLLWDIVQQVLSAHGVVPAGDLAQRIKEFLTPRLSKECSELTERARREVARFRGLAHLQAKVSEEFRPAEDGLFARVDLFAKQLSRAPVSPGSSVQNFYGSTVGAVQTGAGATATVQQSIVVGDTKATETALLALSEALSAITVSGAFSQRELLELVADLVSEVRKPQPSRLKVSQLAAGLGTALQTTAAVKPAYELVRVALLGWGINLPIIP